VFEASHNHKTTMGRPGKKAVPSGNEDDPSIAGEDQGLDREMPQDPNTSNASEAEERRLKEL
jgi:hypothetical protein